MRPSMGMRKILWLGYFSVFQCFVTAQTLPAPSSRAISSKEIPRSLLIFSFFSGSQSKIIFDLYAYTASMSRRVFLRERSRTAGEHSEVGWSDWLAVFGSCFCPPFKLSPASSSDSVWRGIRTERQHVPRPPRRRPRRETGASEHVTLRDGCEANAPSHGRCRGKPHQHKAKRKLPTREVALHTSRKLRSSPPRLPDG